MKTIVVIVGAALLIISAVMFSLMQRGAALKPAGVIKPAEIGADVNKIGKQIGVRLFPDFNSAKTVVWRVEDQSLVHIPITTVTYYHGPTKPALHDLRTGVNPGCKENCWYIQTMDGEVPDAPSVEVFVQYFDRDDKVPEVCEMQKILTVECMRPVTVREVRRKIKTSAPHYFMQRYQKEQFYLYIEKP